jgi:alpha-D-ribose 1-methylphosphonate 5-triphosphate synthase subunit PhnG
MTQGRIDERIAERRRAARVLSRASQAELAALWDGWEGRPEIAYVRGPEAGIVMVQGRVGGTGDRFNLGEATVTRATVTLHGPEVEGASGTSYVLGSHPEHAGLAAVFDALLSVPGRRERVLTGVIGPLERRQSQRDAEARADARSTVVDFFTVAREHG